MEVTAADGHGFTKMAPVQFSGLLFERKLRQYPAINTPYLSRKIQVIWEKVTISDTVPLVYSMSERLKQIIAAKGGHIKY